VSTIGVELKMNTIYSLSTSWWWNSLLVWDDGDYSICEM